MINTYAELEQQLEPNGDWNERHYTISFENLKHSDVSEGRSGGGYRVLTAYDALREHESRVFTGVRAELEGVDVAALAGVRFTVEISKCVRFEMLLTTIVRPDTHRFVRPEHILPGEKFQVALSHRERAVLTRDDQRIHVSFVGFHKRIV